MWYASAMPQFRPDKELDTAAAAVAFAVEVRRYHRRRSRKDAEQRISDIERALGRIADAMAPLRSEIGKFPHGPQTEKAEENREEIREMSRSLQRERRKLWKMQRRG